MYKVNPKSQIDTESAGRSTTGASCRSADSASNENNE